MGKALIYLYGAALIVVAAVLETQGHPWQSLVLAVGAVLVLGAVLKQEMGL